MKRRHTEAAAAKVIVDDVQAILAGTVPAHRVAYEAMYWMLIGHAALGGASPIQAIKAGKIGAVRGLVVALRRERRKAAA